MSAIDTLTMALKNLYKRKLRTFLTVLGVVVGACAIIIMISLGLAINKSFEDRMMSTQNATIIEMYNYDAYYGYNKQAKILDDAAIAQIAKLPNVEAVTPLLEYWGLRSVIGRYSTNLNIYGVYPEALEALGFTVAEGQMLTSDDTWGILFGANVPATYRTQREQESYRWWMDDGGSQKAKVDVLRDRIKASFDWNFGRESYTGNEGGYDDYVPEDENTQKVVKPYNVYGVGIMQLGEDYRSSNYSFMNIETVKKILEDEAKWYQSTGGGRNSQTTYGYYYGYIKCTDVNSVSSVIEALKDMGFSQDSVYSPTTYINEIKDTMSSLQILLGAMGVISLFIASIGISNTMIMSTVERTKEIGVMKVIGASLRDVRKLFLLESAIIGFFGGGMGVGVSFVVSYFLNKYGLSFFKMVQVYGEQTGDVSIIPAWLALASLAFAAVIGLVAGFFPAQRATKLSALAAIRSE